MAWSNLFDAFSSAGDPGGGRDATKFYAFDGKSHADAINAIVGGTAGAVVAAGESPAATTYGNLTTSTDKVTAVIGSSEMALVLIYANIVANTSGGGGYMSYAMSGANTVAATDTKALLFEATTTGGAAAGEQTAFGAFFLETGLTPGSTLFQAQYRYIANPPTFSNRRIAVIPFP